MRALKFDPELARPLFASLDQIHLVTINPIGPGIHGKDYGRDVEAAIDDAAKANANGFNVYWTVNHAAPGLSKKPSKRDIRAARFVHVDIDPPKSGGAFDKDTITAALSGIACPPSFIIDSGGGLQAFWRLEDPCANLDSIEAINLQVRDWFAADACQNIDRLMRVPGSINWPDKRKIERGRKACLARWASADDGLSYAPEDLAASFPQAQSTGPNLSSEPLALPAGAPLLAPDDLGLGCLDPLRLAIETPPGQDRSGDGLAVARLMANGGHSDVQIMGMLLNPANAVSGHFLEQRDPRRAVARAIQLVRRDSPPEGETLHAPIMTDADFDQFVANEKAKVRRVMVPATLQLDDGDELADPCPRIGTPGWLRDLGDGALAQFVEHTSASAPSPQPWLTLGAGLAMFGAAAGRRYAGPTNLRTNIYAIGVADSGGGKDHPLRASTRLMIAAGLADHIGSSKIASGAGLLTAITANPSIYFPLDEVGFLISSAADRKRAPRHLTEIIDNLTEFYSLADSTFLGIAYANAKEKPREVIEQPCLCLFGVTTPGVFWGSLSSDNVIDGSLARMLIFESENHYPDPQHQLASNEPPVDLVELVKAVAKGADGSMPFPLGNSASAIPKPWTVPYAQAVVSGEIVAGPHVRNACKRHIADLKRKDGIWFDHDAAGHAFAFFEEVLKLSEGQFEGQPFELQPSQAFIVGSLFGWKRKDGRRRFRRAYIEQGKGNGKSPVAGGIGIYGMTACKEAGAQIYAAAAKKEQANILFRDAVRMVRQSPALARRLEFSGGPGREFNIAHLASGSFFRPVSRDTGKTGSGPRPYFVLADEVHELPDRSIIEMLERGFKFRRDPLLFMITNSGSDRNSVAWEEHEHAIRVAAGNPDAVGADGLVQITLSAGFDENDADLAIARAAILVKTASLFENREGAACLAFDTLVGQLKCRWI